MRRLPARAFDDPDENDFDAHSNRDIIVTRSQKLCGTDSSGGVDMLLRSCVYRDTMPDTYIPCTELEVSPPAYTGEVLGTKIITTSETVSVAGPDG
ncbi:hypothetical protein Tco_0699446 [Tanacetum coccineum]